MARAFYPFVEEDAQEGAETRGASLDEARCAARIAVYDDLSAAPRVVVVEPKDTRSYLEEITATVTRLSHEQGGQIPFTVIREVVENLIHAYFIEPAISILSDGNTIRFADQGPGIKEKGRALEYGTTSATEEMKRYIRGVGSGLPYAQQYLRDKGGSLEIEDNIAGGTIVTIRMGAGERPEPVPQTYPQVTGPATQPLWQQPYPPQGAWPAQGGYPQHCPQGYPQAYPAQQPYGAGAYPQVPTYPQADGAFAQGAAAYQAPTAPVAAPQAPAPQPARPAVELSERARLVLAYLEEHEAVGPKELVEAYGRSQATWTRELQALEQAGILAKRGGQKRYLTQMGATLL